MADRNWRRTAPTTRADCSRVPDDWRLVDPQFGAVTRIYRMTGGPQGGQWFRARQIDAQGRSWNSSSYNVATGVEAKAVVEAIVAGFAN